MRNVMWIGSVLLAFAAGVWLVPKAGQKTGASNELRRPTRRDTTNPELNESMMNVERRLASVEANLARLSELRTVAPATEPPSTDSSRSTESTSKSDDSKKERTADRLALANAPPLQDMLAAALTKGAISAAEIRAFHHRLDELPPEEQPAVLKRLQAAINEEKIHLER